jgi:hypothetical protein
LAARERRIRETRPGQIAFVIRVLLRWGSAGRTCRICRDEIYVRVSNIRLVADGVNQTLGNTVALQRKGADSDLTDGVVSDVDTAVKQFDRSGMTEDTL